MVSAPCGGSNRHIPDSLNTSLCWKYFRAGRVLRLESNRQPFIVVSSKSAEFVLIRGRGLRPPQCKASRSRHKEHLAFRTPRVGHRFQSGDCWGGSGPSECDRQRAMCGLLQRGPGCCDRHRELLKLRIAIAESTVARYMPYVVARPRRAGEPSCADSRSYHLSILAWRPPSSVRPTA